MRSAAWSNFTHSRRCQGEARLDEVRLEWKRGRIAIGRTSDLAEHLERTEVAAFDQKSELKKEVAVFDQTIVGRNQSGG